MEPVDVVLVSESFPGFSVHLHDVTLEHFLVEVVDIFLVRLDKSGFEDFTVLLKGVQLCWKLLIQE